MPYTFQREYYYPYPALKFASLTVRLLQLHPMKLPTIQTPRYELFIQMSGVDYMSGATENTFNFDLMPKAEDYYKR